VLDELQQAGMVNRADLETWLRPAYIARCEGETLIVAAPNAVARDRIVARLLSPLRAAIAATIGAPVEIGVEVAGEQGGQVADQTAS
jgi:chromosomal replication initiation ATPase DnaA